VSIVDDLLVFRLPFSNATHPKSIRPSASWGVRFNRQLGHTSQCRRLVVWWQHESEIPSTVKHPFSLASQNFDGLLT